MISYCETSSASFASVDFSRTDRLEIMVLAKNVARATLWRLLRLMLEAAGHRVTEASSESEAVQLEARFDLVLMDLQTPGMDGAATTKALREPSSETCRRQSSR